MVASSARWGEEYEIASGEDVDLCFKVWVNELDVVYDQRVLVDHIGKGSASRLDDWQGLWARNRQRFLDKWMSSAPTPQLSTCDDERFSRNRAIARSTAGWMERYFTTRDKQRQRMSLTGVAAMVRERALETAHTIWRKVRPRLSPKVARSLGSAGRKLG